MIDFGGLKLRNPVVIASGPVSATIEQLEAADRAGAAAASIKQVMTRQTFRGNLRAYSVPDHVMIFPIDRRLDVRRRPRAGQRSQTAEAGNGHHRQFVLPGA